jgi:dTDP-4-dehydrorhamnose reductase
MRILVTGASGLLGLNFALQFYEQHKVIGLFNDNLLAKAPFEVCQVDLAQPGIPPSVVSDYSPDCIIHCAAMANVDACEAEPEMARYINAVVPGELAAAAYKARTKLVHISTDAVFDGLQGGYTERDAARPINTYARTKLAGERAVMDANPDAIVARVNFFGWSLSGTRSLAEFFINNLQAGKRVNGFTDVWFCPLQVTLLGEILMKMIERGLSGLYHTVSRECLSKYDFGCRIARQFGLDERLVTPASWLDGNLAAPRAPNLHLKVDKLEKALGEPLPDQAAGLDRFYSQYREGYAEKMRRMGLNS